MVSALLYHLPLDKRYKVIFMRREMKEILASQKVMLKRLGKETNDISDTAMAIKYKKHLEEIEIWLNEQKHINVLYVEYNDIIKNSYTNAEAICNFLEIELNVEKMVRVIDNNLYRQRNE
jgi:hypothetical protein